MVAISLYRGNLHRVPDVPRRWLMSKPSISLKDFRSLIHKRNKSLSRITTTINPNPNPNPNSESVVKEEEEEEEEEVVVEEENGGSKQTPLPTIEPPHAQSQENNNLVEDAPSQQQQQQQQQPQPEEKEDHRMVESAEDQNTDSILEQPRETTESVPAPDIKCDAPEAADDLKNGGDGGNSQVLEKEPAAVEINKIVDLPSDKVKEKKELEEKLQILNEKKHNLVQMLKQILNAEEEMKRQNSMQASVARPPVPLQVEVTADFGSSPRQAATRMGSEANCSGDLEGESEDASNHHVHARHLHQIHSPSASSPLRRTGHSSFQHNSVHHTTRASGASGSGRTQSPSSLSMGVIASPSPSRFAPTGTQGHHANLPPPVSLSGTHFMASSPSPAASGGTSVFRDARLTSPSWN